MTESPDRAAHAFIGAFVDELARAGVSDVCVAPGSRSTPLALLLARHRAIRVWVHLDERSAAYFALGVARARGKPAALLCTSGTAAANFFPAVVEAHNAGVPLLVFTADRPPELRDIGAAQTIDQNRLYGAHAKWFVEVALPDASPAMVRYARTLAHRAVAVASATPAGVVHLNFPFREPLVPAAGDAPRSLPEPEALAWTGRGHGTPWVTVSRSEPMPDAQVVRGMAEMLRRASRPLIVCGPQTDPELRAPLVALAWALGAPVLADPLSQLRWGPHDRRPVIEAYDATLRQSILATALEPDLVLRVGGTPTSKPLLEFLARHGTATQVVVDGGRWPDPMLVASHLLRADPRSACTVLLDAVKAVSAKLPPDTRWLSAWRDIDDRARQALHDFCLSLDESFEGRALAEVAAMIPDDGTLFVSSSMPVRDLDTFGRGRDVRMRVFANRGANGIDGVVSTAMGVAATQGGQRSGPVVLVIGDIALYHDMNGLLAAKRHELDITIVLLNNDGGGIFSFLPQAADPEHFELLFGTPHGLDFTHAARMYGARYCRATSWDSFRTAVMTGIRGRGLHLVEVRTERERNVELHRLAREAVARALAEPPPLAL